MTELTPDEMRQRLRDRQRATFSSGNVQAMQQLLHRHFETLDIKDTTEFTRQLGQSEAQWCSQNGEDGILLFLLARIGRNFAIPSRTVEIGAGDGWENNTINLAAHRGFQSLLIDPSWALPNLGFPLLGEYPTFAVRKPIVRTDFVEPDNADSILTETGFAGDLAVLSIDVDGNDFWVWRGLTVANPMIVIMELNTRLGGDVAWAMPYERGYDYWGTGRDGHLGASAPGYDVLARQRGYVFAGCDRNGVNGFWVKRGLIPELGDGVPMSYIWEATPASAGTYDFADKRDRLPWVVVTEDIVSDESVARDRTGEHQPVRPAVFADA